MSSPRKTYGARVTALVVIAIAAIAVVALPAIALAVPVTSSDATATYANTAVIHLTATPPAGGIYKTTAYSIDGKALTYVSAYPAAATVTFAAATIADLRAHTIDYFTIDATSSVETTWGAYTGATTRKTFTLTSTYPSTVAFGITSTYMNSASISLLGVAAVGGLPVAATWYSVDDGAPVSGTSVAVTGIGDHTLTFWSTDTGGNVGLSQTVPFSIVDTIKPGMTCNAGATYVGTANITLSATDGGAGVQSICYKLDGGDTVVVAPTAIRSAASDLVAGTPSPAGHFATGVAGVDAACAGCHTILPAGGGGVSELPASFSTSVAVSSVGSHSLEYWAVDGSGLAGTHQTAAFAVTAAAPLTTSITIRTNATSVARGKSFNLSGVVSPAGLIGTNIQVMVKKPGKSYYSYSSARTVYDNAGVPSWWYRYQTLTSMAAGTYKFYAYVPASASFATSQSSILSVSVK